MTTAETLQPTMRAAEVIPFRGDADTDPSYERVHGRYEKVELYSDEFVKMAQVRKERNAVRADLKESIRRHLINPLDVACLDSQTLGDYIDFVNTVWGTQTSIEEFDTHMQPDGTYFLIVAGHSRHVAICELEADGTIPRYRIEAKVHQVTSPEEIIQIQLDENLHTQPSKERQAMAVVETYEWGRSTGRWSNQREFLEQNNYVGKTMLSDALRFSTLPRDIRDHVTSGVIGYAAGLELGRAEDEIRRHCVMKAGIAADEVLSDDARELIDSAVQLVLRRHAAHILNKKLGANAATRYMQQERNRLKRELIQDIEAREKAQEDALFELELLSPEQLLRERVDTARKDLQQYLREVSQNPSESARRLIHMNSDVLPTDTMNRLLEELRESSLHTAQLVGSVATRRVVTQA